MTKTPFGGVQVPLQMIGQLIAGCEARLAGVAGEGQVASVTPLMNLKIPEETSPMAAVFAHEPRTIRRIRRRVGDTASIRI